MAGNVREWNWNETGIGRVISGAGYDDATYMFTNSGVIFRLLIVHPQNGFRCVKYIDKEKIPENAFALIDMNVGMRDYSKEVPVSESIFKVYKDQFLYDSTALNAVVEERYESADDWTC